jgi:hypothetical protein
MADQAQRICDLAQESAAANDHETALRALTELRSEVDAFVRAHVGRALAAGRSFSDVARALGISRQAAHRRFRDLAPARRRDPLVATDAARRVVRLAQAEALAAGASPGSEHVLLGILRTDCEAARALRFDGVTPERARACVRSDGVRTPEGESCHTRGAGQSSSLPRILKQAARVALRRGDRELDPDPLLLAAVADPDGGARRTLTALSVEPESLRARLRRGTAQRPAVSNA